MPQTPYDLFNMDEHALNRALASIGIDQEGDMHLKKRRLQGFLMVKY
jgi:hypothetical protein